MLPSRSHPRNWTQISVSSPDTEAESKYGIDLYSPDISPSISPRSKPSRPAEKYTWLPRDLSILAELQSGPPIFRQTQWTAINLGQPSLAANPSDAEIDAVEGLVMLRNMVHAPSLAARPQTTKQLSDPSDEDSGSALLEATPAKQVEKRVWSERNSDEKANEGATTGDDQTQKAPANRVEKTLRRTDARAASTLLQMRAVVDSITGDGDGPPARKRLRHGSYYGSNDRTKSTKVYRSE